jgi:hypothetical protein
MQSGAGDYDNRSSEATTARVETLIEAMRAGVAAGGD